MTYSVTTAYDNRIPSWAGNGSPFRMFACHDTEGGQGRTGALGTLRFLIDRADRGASYHEMWWYHESTDQFGVIRIVPPWRAAGSVAPQPYKYMPTKWVKDSLGAGWWDPNQGIYAISIAGHVADVNRYAKNPKFLDHAHRRFLELSKEFGIVKRAEHFQFNPATRSDWGKTLMTALGGHVTPDTLPRIEDDMDLDLIAKLEQWTVPAGSSLREMPSDTAPIVATLAGGPIVTVGETSDGLWRLALYGARAEKMAWVARRPLTPKTPGGNPTLQDRWYTAVYTDEPFGAGDTSELEATVKAQAEKIAGLQTDLASTKIALTAAERASAVAAEVKKALKNFLA